MSAGKSEILRLIEPIEGVGGCGEKKEGAEETERKGLIVGIGGKGNNGIARILGTWRYFVYGLKLI